MATIRIICISIMLVTLLPSCTKYNFIDGGKAEGVHDCSMWDYMQLSPYNWDSTRIMIEHAGLRSLFEGKEQKQITFFGITNHAIRTYMLEHNETITDPSKHWVRVTDIPQEFCYNLLTKLIIPDRFMLKDIPRGNRVKQTNSNGELIYVNEGGKSYAAITGNLFCYTFQDPYQDVANAGLVSLYLVSMNRGGTTAQRIVSSDIQTTNGVVHALSYGFKFSDL